MLKPLASHTDLVFTIGVFGLTVGTIALMRGPREKAPPLSSSGLIAPILAVFSLTYLALQLYFSAIMQAVSASIWFVIGVKRIMHLRDVRRQPERS